MEYTKVMKQHSEKSTEWEKILTNSISEKELICRIYFKNFKVSKLLKPNLKMVKNWNIYFSKEDIQVAKWYIKDA